MNFDKEKELEDKKIKDIKDGVKKPDVVSKDDKKSVMYYG